jgi:hypothetical protein
VDDITLAKTAKRKAHCVGLLGPMQAAWRQTFEGALDTLAPLLVIVWHSEWMRPDRELWVELHNKLTAIAEAKEPTRILVIIFGDTPDDLGEEKDWNPLTVLLRALSADTLPDEGSRRRPAGWASISEASRFQKACAKWVIPNDPSESALLRLCAVCAEITHWPGGYKRNVDLPSLTLTQFFQFLSDPVRFRASILHGAENPQQERQRLNLLKWLAAHTQIPRSLPLKILIVENDKNEPKNSAENVARRFESLKKVSACPLGYLHRAEFYVVSERFDQLKSEGGREHVRGTKYADGQWAKPNGGSLEAIPWLELDLVLQDVMLGNNVGHVSGLELASFYFDACPQALVFLLTGLDIESLVVSGDINWKFIDAVIPKEGLESLWFEYGRCFRERFGRMFWLDWAAVEESDRKLLRCLFGSLRKWQIEPDILWHGQTLPEMIDHANRHISALWRLVNDFVGTLIENGGADDSVLDRQHRVALALAVWMHDVGHRGDEYVAGSINIRASHAGISERLLLRNPDAYSLGWLVRDGRTPYKACEATNADGRDERLSCRNRTECSAETKPLCLLREVGLLCRHHQSNAPLDVKSIEYMDSKNKTPSIYSLIPTGSQNRPVPSEEFLKSMTGSTGPSDTRAQRLDEFGLRDPNGFRRVAGLLRMLDALQLHRSRVGSAASIASFVEFLDNRDHWCKAQLITLEAAKSASGPATREYLRSEEDLMEMKAYKKILNTQEVHYWRQAVVHDVQVLWRWRDKGEALVDVTFILNERALANLHAIIAKRPDITLPERETAHTLISRHVNKQEILKWVDNVREEVINSEHASQHRAPGEGQLGYLGALTPNVTFRVVIGDTDQKALDPKDPYVIHSSKAPTVGA